jgi:hypothetical protein
MRRNQLTLIAVILALLIVVLYIFVAKPTLVLPTVTVVLPQASPLNAFARQLNFKELRLQVRTDGKTFVVADGKELAQVAYTPASLNNVIQLSEKFLLPRNAASAIRPIPLLFPAWAANLSATGLTIYYVLPIEMTVRIIAG